MHHLNFRWLLFLTLFLAQGFPLAFGDTVIIPVRHRLPEEIARVLAPVLEPAENVVATSSGLLVKARATRIAEIRALISELDRPLKTLAITVLQSTQANLAQLNAGVQGSIHLPLGPAQGQGFWYHTQSDNSRDIWQSLKILEGHPAYIAVGQEQPVPFIQIYGYPPQVLGGIEYKPITQGFEVVPRMVGCKVRLQVSPWSQQRTGAGSIAIQSASTTVEANLGQWIELGSHDTSGNNQSSPLMGRRYTTRRDKARIFLKVEAKGGC